MFKKIIFFDPRRRKKIRNIIILGPPGSGKGTQAKILAEKLGYFYFGMGDLMREEAKKNTALGQRFQAVWDKGEGQLVREEDTHELFLKTVQSLKENQGIVFDGYPRSKVQAEHLKESIGEDGMIVLNIEVSDQSLIERIGKRRICGRCGQIFLDPSLKKCHLCQGKLIQRQEDSPEVVQKRLQVYNDETRPLIEYFQKKGKLIEIDGEPQIEKVAAEILKALDGNQS